MDSLTDRLKALSSAEDFFAFFAVPFDEPVVQVNRLHILKRFYQYLHKSALPPADDEVGQFRHYRTLLGQVCTQRWLSASSTAAVAPWMTKNRICVSPPKTAAASCAMTLRCGSVPQLANPSRSHGFSA